MFRDWTFRRRLAAGFGLATLAIATIIVLSYVATAELIANNASVVHSRVVRQNIAQLLSAIKDAESGQRGYLIAGRDAYLEPYTEALDIIAERLGRLRTLTADNPEQQARLDQLQPILKSRLDQLAKGIELRKTEGFAAAAAFIDTDSGKTSMEQIEALLGAAESAEVALLDGRSAAAQESANWSMATIMWGGAASIVLVALIGWLTTRLLSTEIGAAVSHMRSSSAELQAAANQQAAGVKEQVASMSEINATISELLASSRQIAASAQRVADISKETTSAATSADGTVEDASESIGGIRRQVDQVVAHMLDLGQKSQQIGTILDIVSELAEQTNILSINATIEAAGAGESGRRFATVAEEIRKLSDRVAISAKEIRALIEDVRGSVNTTVMATETGSKTVEAGTRQFGDVAKVFKQIARLVAATTEAAREIELSTKQQATAVEQVTVAISNVAQATRENEISAGQTIQTATELASTSRALLRLVQSSAAA